MSIYNRKSIILGTEFIILNQNSSFLTQNAAFLIQKFSIFYMRRARSRKVSRGELLNRNQSMKFEQKRDISKKTDEFCIIN